MAKKVLLLTDISFLHNIFSNHLVTITYTKNPLESDFILNDFIICDSNFNGCYKYIVKYSSKIILYVKSFNNEIMYNLYKNNIFKLSFGEISNTTNTVKYPEYVFTETNYIKSANFNGSCCLFNNNNINVNNYNIVRYLKNIFKIFVIDKITSDYTFCICSDVYEKNIGNTINTLTFVCLSGMIPIYYGHLDKYDEKIFNTKRIMFYDPNNTKSIELLENNIKYLMSDKKVLKDFMSQNIFNDKYIETINYLNMNFNFRLNEYILSNKNTIIECDKINSFDVFDTLIARTVPTPQHIFLLIERNYPYTNFKHIRSHAQELSNGLFDDIYDKFKKLTNESDEVINKLKEFEILTEIENTIPIMSNILQVKPNDILVSDMYLSKESILRILKHHNVLNTNLYVTPSGKRHSYIWEELLQKHIINKHIGDNKHSDVLMPTKFGIKTQLTTTYEFLELEKRVFCIDPTISNILRRFRLINPFVEKSPEYEIFNEQILSNIPVNLYICKQIANILKKENRDTILFTGRDSCLIIKLFEKIYPEYKSIYFYSSRKLYEKHPEDYIKYVKSLYNKEKCLLFDIASTFNTATKFFMKFFGHIQRILIFVYADSVTENIDNENMSYLTIGENKIEIYNAYIYGTAIDFKDNEPIYLPSENNYKYPKLAQDITKCFLKYIDNNFDLFRENKLFDNHYFWKHYYNYISYKEYYKFIYKHELYDLNILFKKYNLNKSSINYKYVMSEIHKNHINEYKLLDFNDSINNDILSLSLYIKYITVDIPSIELLEIESSININSVVMWQEYFHQYVNVTFFDSEYRLLENKISSGTRIYRGYNNIKHVQDKQYNLIIDNQDMFKNLWKYVKPNGYYIIEKTDNMELFKQWKNNNWITSNNINIIELEEIKQNIENITINELFICIKRY